jgi:PAS domain S-box-containing protein
MIDLAHQPLHPRLRSLAFCDIPRPPDGTIMVDASGKVDRVNEAAEAMFGFARERMIGQSIEMLIPERFRDRHIAHRSHYMKDPKTGAMGANLDLFAHGSWPVPSVVGRSQSGPT